LLLVKKTEKLKKLISGMYHPNLYKYGMRRIEGKWISQQREDGSGTIETGKTLGSTTFRQAGTTVMKRK